MLLSSLRPLYRLLIREQGPRRCRIHRRDQPIEAEHLSLGLKEICLKDPIKRAVASHQLRGAFWLNPGCARQFVRRITAEKLAIWSVQQRQSGSIE